MDKIEQAGKSSEAKLTALYRLGRELILLRDERQIAAAVLEIAEEVLDFQDSDFFLLDEVRRELYVAARRGELEQAGDLRLPLEGERGITVVAARTGRPVYAPDVRNDPRYVDTGFAATSELAVPVQIEERVLGVINVESRDPDAYTPADVQLLSTLASQAALALENARLYAQERRRADELAVINQAARRVSGSLDLRETLDGIVEAAAELVPCVLAEISLWDEARQILTLQALRCEPERTYPIGRTFPPGKGYTGWVVRNRRPLLVSNVDGRQDIRPDLLPGELPFKAYVGLPLLAGDELIGTLVLIHDRPDSFDEDDLRLLEGLAGQAAVAVRNARLFEETRRKARELTALNAVAAAINQALDLGTLLADAVERVIQVVRADGGGIRLLDPASERLILSFSRGISAEYVATVRDLRLGEGIVGDVALTGKPALVADMQEDARVQPRVLVALREEGLRSFAVVPLRSRQEAVGTLGVVSYAPGAFGAADMELLTAIGHQLGVAIENGRLRQQALEAERLAAVGRVATSVAHDLRSPLGGIIRSAEFLARPELSDSTRQKLSRAVVALAHRLINTTQEILDYTRGGHMTLRLTPCNLSTFLDEVIEVLKVDFSDRGIEVVTEWGYTGELRMDTDRMAQVVYNIAANARDAMPEGGRLTIATHRADDWVEMRFTDTGPGVPSELTEHIFEPFFSYGKREGAGLGLAIAKRIVREHGGEIEVESHAKGGATFVVRLPPGEQERRAHWQAEG
ncbi:MAG: GAF domain-containing protein [Anaerolineae bacterium]